MLLPKAVIEIRSFGFAAPELTARNEVRKFSATWLNAVSVALIATGIIVPLVTFYPAYLDHATGMTADPHFSEKVFRVGWLTGAVLAFALLLHVRALFIVRGVEEAAAAPEQDARPCYLL